MCTVLLDSVTRCALFCLDYTECGSFNWGNRDGSCQLFTSRSATDELMDAYPAAEQTYWVRELACAITSTTSATPATKTTIAAASCKDYCWTSVEFTFADGKTCNCYPTCEDAGPCCSDYQRMCLKTTNKALPETTEKIETTSDPEQVETREYMFPTEE
jgi:hypothetical protein